MRTKSIPPFHPAKRSATRAEALMIAAIALTCISVISGLMQINLLVRAASGLVFMDEAAANDSRQRMIGILQLFMEAGTAIAFLIWFYSVHRNLLYLDLAFIKYSPGWAVGGFFIPFLNFVRPFQVMREVWNGSNPELLNQSGSELSEAPQYQTKTPALIGAWWGLFLASSILGRIVFQASRSSSTIEALTALSILLVVCDALNVPGSLLAIRLIGRITGWQVVRNTRIQERVAATTIVNEMQPDSPGTPGVSNGQ